MGSLLRVGRFSVKWHLQCGLRCCRLPPPYFRERHFTGGIHSHALGGAVPGGRPLYERRVVRTEVSPTKSFSSLRIVVDRLRVAAAPDGMIADRVKAMGVMRPTI